MSRVPRLSLGIGALIAASAVIFGAVLGGFRGIEHFAADGCALDREGLGAFVDIPGGGFVKGAEPVYPEEGPAQKVFVSPFRLQAHEVTNSQFRRLRGGHWLCDRGGTKRWLRPIQRESNAGGLHVLVETRPHGDLENAGKAREQTWTVGSSIQSFT